MPAMAADNRARIDAEWVTLSAFRDLLRVASRGDFVKSSYNHALDLGGALYPDLLGSDTSLLRRVRESDTTGEYRQRAKLLSVRENKVIHPLDLVRHDIEELKGLLHIAEQLENDRSKVDKLKRRLAQLIAAEGELNPVVHSETQLIFHDAHNAHRSMPVLGTGRGRRDFQLPDGKVLRLRVFHPDKPEHVTGADIIYERHSPRENRASIVAVQYKIWEDRSLYLSEPRMEGQIKRLAGFLCDSGICNRGNESNEYRFPFCSAFLRPTDRLQVADQKLFSVGEHLPICMLSECANAGPRGAALLEYEGMKGTSLSGEIFEELFNKGKIGSRMLSYDELHKLYSTHAVESSEDSVVIYAQEF